MIKTIKGVEKKVGDSGKKYAKISFDDCSANVFDDKVVETAEANIGKQVDVEFKEKNGYKNITTLVARADAIQIELPVQVQLPRVSEYSDAVRLNLDCLDRAIRITSVCQVVDKDGNAMKLDRKVMYRLAEDIKKWAKGEQNETIV